MKQKKYTKRALCMSLLSMLLCCSMLVGTTFAWFTDSVTSGRNKITAGNLDVELYYQTAPEGGELKEEAWVRVDEKTNVFGETQWEPGHTEVVYLKVVNAGSLALKYKLSVLAVDKVIGTSVTGKPIDLETILKFGVKEDVETPFDSRDAAIEAVKDSAVVLSKRYTSGTDQKLAKGASDVLALVVYMPTETDNDANYRGETAPSIDLGIQVYATQDTVENDSFNNEYDLSAEYDSVTYAMPDNLTERLAEVEEGGALVLAPGEYDVDETTGLFLQKKNVDVIGAGPDKTVIVGCVRFGTNDSHDVYTDGSWTLKNVTVKVDPEHVQQVGVAIMGNEVSSGCTFTIDNCVIDGFQFGTQLGGSDIQDSTLVIKNTTFKNDFCAISIGQRNTLAADKESVKFEGVTYEVQDYRNDKNLYFEKLNSEGTTGQEPGVDGKDVVFPTAGSTEAVQEAIENAEPGDTVQVGSGVFELPDTLPEDVTIVGNGPENTVIEVKSNYNLDVGAGNTAAIEDVTIDGSAITSGHVINVQTGSLALDNVVITGGGRHTWDASIQILGSAESLTVTNSTISGAFRGIIAESTGADVTVEGCDIDAVYPVNFDGCSGTLTVSNSKLHGWTSYGDDCKGATFTNVEFTLATSGYNNVRGYVDTTFTDCTFEEGFWYGAANYTVEIHLNNCKMADGTPITADNVKGILESTDNAGTTVYVDNTPANVEF